MKSNPLSTMLKTSLMCGVAASGFAVTGAFAQDAAQADEDNVDIIYVTSRKRPEIVTEIPMNIAVVGAEEISHRNLVMAEDAFRTFAGAANPRGELILRGLSGGNDSTPETTATFTDGIPFDFGNLYDVERIEVLRGPQGTLWGSNAIGGTVQVITNKPNLNEFLGSASVMISSEKNRPGMGTRASGMFNMPLVEEKMAIRVTASSGHEDGKIYNPYTNNSGKEDDFFVRAQLGWEPTENTKVNLSWINTRDFDSGRDGSDHTVPGYYYDFQLTANDSALYGYDVTPAFTDCADPGMSRVECYNDRFGTSLNGHNPKFADWELMDPYNEDKYHVVALTLEQTDIIEGVDLTYAGSWRHYRNRGQQSGWTRLDANDMFRTWIIDEYDDERITQELRLQNNDFDAPLQWTVGAFYDKTKQDPTDSEQWQYHASDPQSRAIAAYLWNVYWDSPSTPYADYADPTALGIAMYGDPTKNYNVTTNKYEQREFALFGEVGYTADLGDAGRMEFVAGLRYYDLKDVEDSHQSGQWVDPVNQTLDTTMVNDGETGFRKKFSVNYMPNDDFSIYALYAEGYRPGGNNGPSAPNDCRNDENIGSYVDRYESDQIKNYEIGFKGFAFNRNMSFSAAAYQIDWEGVQASVYMPSCGFSYTANAAAARSKGVEFESTTNLTDTLKFLANASYTKSTMQEAVPALQAEAGDDMTMVPKYNFYLALDQAFTIGEQDAFIRVEANGYGESKSHFRAKDTDISPAYTVVGLSAGLNLSENMDVSVHVRNLFNKEIINYKRQRYNSDWSLGARTYYYGRERTISVRLDATF
ncbi:TonB-dependent receptor [Pseudemcibacter aquimaris]|uniref:TonB-dependent receptor n=1 Tax=Pseudemcibacter aquimaris TaxID=2857064 RepID=UPI0020134A25|nr:TonB-dependent receptor [Pseudemcibacter aquimaris]MCC3862037.1 TonB-dependent receptor [Pseudemcibacter aquimaris]WDU58789.1 TonB-dependent receptor [Pseudemcibacter aquimaris]